MKLVFYSGGHDYENEVLDQAMLALTGLKNPKIAFIPSSSSLVDADYKYFINQYKKQKISRFLYFPVDTSVSDVLKKEVFKSDIIHLSGGNTFYFLKHLKRSKLFPELHAFIQRGGVLTGLSAGAIIMTKTIETAEVPHFDRDDNDEKLTNLKAMGLVNFDFFPHYKNSKRYDIELAKFSLKTKRPLYACPDGSGILVDGETTTFVGKVFCFHNGLKFSVKALIS